MNLVSPLEPANHLMIHSLYNSQYLLSPNRVSTLRGLTNLHLQN
jgi:hypothetical protein